VAVVGTATQSAAEAAGFIVSLAPKTFDAESLAVEFATMDLAGKRILMPAAAMARDALPVELRKRGADVQVVEAYRNTLPAAANSRAEQVFGEPLPDWVLFASPSAVEHLANLVELNKLRRILTGSIGPVTSQAIREIGFDVTVEAAERTGRGLVSALLTHYERRPHA
jgi:uroporphyrinogen-III synthase